MHEQLTPAQAQLQILADMFAVTQADVALGIVLILAIGALDLLRRRRPNAG